MIKKGDKVMMCRDDGWARKGWTGVVITANGVNVRVKWDRGAYTYHHAGDLKVINYVYDHARVVMKVNDSWAEKGWQGTVIDKDSCGVRVKWDIGKIFWHLNEKVELMKDQETNPNIAFMMQRKRGS